MMNQGKFNTDTSALKNRIQAHEKFGANDLNSWIFEHLAVSEGLSVLEIGCGTGKQTIPLACRVGSSGNILATDLSKEGLTSICVDAFQKNILERIQTLHCSHDDLAKTLDGSNEKFDRVLASYTLYYSNAPREVIQFLHQVLKPNGLLFYCGPSKENNLELLQFHYALTGRPNPSPTNASKFMEETGPIHTRALFKHVTIYNFQNPISFNSPGALYEYWSSYNLYDQSLDTKFKRAAEEYFRLNKIFETKKRVIGVLAAK